MSAPAILLTGFEPFDRDPVNPSWEVARALGGTSCDGATVRALQLPCVFGRAIDRLDDALKQWQPRLVLCLGLASGRSEISPERIAINIDDARIPDNAGAQPIDTPVIAGGPAAYFSTLPIKAIVRELRAAGLPSSVTNSAGTFVCNHVFYALMHRLATWPALARAGRRAWRFYPRALPARAGRAAARHAQHGAGDAGAGGASGLAHRVACT